MLVYFMVSPDGSCPFLWHGSDLKEKFFVAEGKACGFYDWDESYKVPFDINGSSSLVPISECLLESDKKCELSKAYYRSRGVHGSVYYFIQTKDCKIYLELCLLKIP